MPFINQKRVFSSRHIMQTEKLNGACKLNKRTSQPYSAIYMCLQSPQIVILSILRHPEGAVAFCCISNSLLVSAPNYYDSWEEGNHRQWCEPLQGKPRCGGVPLRKSTPIANDCSCRSWDRPDRMANHKSCFVPLKRRCPIAAEVTIVALLLLAQHR